MSEENNTVVEAELITEEESVTLKFSPALIDPKKEELTALAQKIQSIEVNPDKMTKEDLALINTSKNELVKARTSIEKDGLEARRPANEFVKKVKAYQDELIEIIKPEELRMKELEKAGKEFAMREERMKTLPEFKEKLATIGDEVLVSDSELLALNPNERDAYYNERLGAKLEADRLAKEEADRIEAEAKAAEEAKLAEEKAKQEAEARRLEQEKANLRYQRIQALGMRDTGLSLVYGSYSVKKLEVSEMSDTDFEKLILQLQEDINQLKESEAKAAEEAKQKEIEEAKAQAKAEAEAEAQKKEDERLAKEKAEKEAAEAAERKAAEEKALKEAEEDYQNWLKENNFNPDTDIIENNIMYRKVAIYTKNIEN